MIEELIILTQIIFIDIILAADNAIIIGLIAANFVPKNRKQIILWGVAGALVFKVIFALFATYLFKFYFIRIKYFLHYLEFSITLPPLFFHNLVSFIIKLMSFYLIFLQLNLKL